MFRNPDIVSSIAGRLARLDRVITPADRTDLTNAADGTPLTDLVRTLTDAVDIDRAAEKAATDNHVSDPTHTQIQAAQTSLIEDACRQLAERPNLRQKILDMRSSYTQVLDETSVDTVIDAGYSRDATDRARDTITSWQAFVDEHKDDIKALQILYSRPYDKRLTLRDIKELAKAISRPPHNWTPERLWDAYEGGFREREGH